MSVTKKVISDIVVGLAKALESADDETIIRLHEVIVDSKKSKTLSSDSNKKKSTVKIDRPSRSESLFQDSDTLRSHFSSFETREALATYIEQNYPRKSDLLSACRAVRVPIAKEDDYDALLEKLIDATIGYKLRSRAIRGDINSDS